MFHEEDLHLVVSAQIFQRLVLLSGIVRQDLLALSTETQKENEKSLNYFRTSVNCTCGHCEPSNAY